MEELRGYLLDIPAEFLKNPAGEIILLGRGSKDVLELARQMALVGETETMSDSVIENLPDFSSSFARFALAWTTY